MSTEKRLRQQAKQLLEGKWLNAIVAFVFLAIAALAVGWTTDIFMIVFQVYDLETLEIDSSMLWIEFIVKGTAVLASLFISPVFNGVYKTISNIAYGKNTDENDLLYFFGNTQRYLKTLVFNFVVLGVFLVLISVLNVNGLITDIVAEYTKSAGNAMTLLINTMALFVRALFFVADICIYLVFVHFSMVAYSLNDSLPVSRYTAGMLAFSIKNLGSALKLVFSFVGWILLCFFVVPAFYVLPYIMTSLTVSAKWLFALDKDWGFLC